MADTESILQLGIEAARAGDKEEARNLFRLLTREKPNDPQSWLWLAGVAEDRDEKRGALEQALRLDANNQMAREGLEALGVPVRAATAPPAAAPPPAPEPAPAADFGFDDFDAFTAAAEPAPPPAPARSEPKPTRELSAEEEFAMSLDSLSSLTADYNDQVSQGKDPNDLSSFSIPDFGDDDMDMAAYMNRERVDPSQIEVTAAEAQTPKRKPISKDALSPDKGKGKAKDRDRTKPRAAGKTRTASGGRGPLALFGLIGLLLIGGLLWFLWPRDPEPQGPRLTAEQATATALAMGAIPPGDGSGIITDTNPLTNTGTITDTGVPTNTGAPVDPNTPPPPPPPPAGNVPTINDPALQQAQPAPLTPGVQPINVDSWFFNYTAAQIADGNVMGVQPVGRWVAVSILTFDGTTQGRVVDPGLLVLKDAQGRVYPANVDASVAFYNVYGGHTINITQPAPVGINYSFPVVFDVAPDASGLVLFSPLNTANGYALPIN